MDTGFVVTVHWSASKFDGNFAASTCSAVIFAEQSDQSIIPYADLTETQVIEWVKASLGAEQLAAIDASLTQNIALQKNPVTATGTPWAL